MTDNTIQLSVVIPVRIDSRSRLENLQTVVAYLLHNTQSLIIILEADDSSKIDILADSERLKVHYIQDSNLIFHRTKYINQLLKLAQTPYVGIWDSDILVDSNSIRESVAAIENGAVLSLPYDGNFIFLSDEITQKARKKITSFNNGSLGSLGEGFHLIRPSVGGAYIVNKEGYISAGGENEHFIGWGPEDMERVKRLEILGFSIHRSKGSLFHLHHPRGVNSILGSDQRAINNLDEFVRICSMTKEELQEYVTKQLLFQ